MRSPLQAQVVQWLAQPGDAVRQGQPLLVVEAMKMEHKITAPVEAVVTAVNVAAGDRVEAGDRLLELDNVLDAQDPVDASTDAGNTGDESTGDGTSHR